MTVRICHSCAATSVETRFPRKIRGQPAPKLCLACEATALVQSAPIEWPTNPRPAQTRASYRAAYRARLKSAQGDLVDLLVKPP
jgi:hypothetical protein